MHNTTILIIKHQQSHLRFRENSGERLFDAVGMLNNSKLVRAQWRKTCAPSLQKDATPSFMLSESEEVEGFSGEAIGGSAGKFEF